MNSRLVVRNFHAGVVKNANLDAVSEEILMISGPSGCGKSCLLKGIADLIPNQGEVSLDGTEKQTQQPSVWRRQVQLIPAESRWWFHTAHAHFQHPPDYGIWNKIGLTKEDGDKNTGHLSTGQRQRFALLRGLQFHPSVLLLDEPTSGLDDETEAQVEHFITEYMHKHKLIVIWTSHNKRQIDRLGSGVFTFSGLQAKKVKK